MHWQTFLSFTLALGLPQNLDLQVILPFLEFLLQNSLSPRVIKNYLASIKAKAQLLGWSIESLNHPSIHLFFKNITIHSSFVPKYKGYFDITTIRLISQSCAILEDPVLFRAIFLVAFHAFLRISNIAPHSRAAFSPSRHLLVKDIIFAPPGAHILIKWAKCQQEADSYKFVQDQFLCPVQALQALIKARPTTKEHPLFSELSPPFYQVIDTKVRDALKIVLNHLSIPHLGHGFHSFRRSGAIHAFNSGVSIDHIKAHGGWRSDAVWTYLKASSIPPASVSLATQNLS